MKRLSVIPVYTSHRYSGKRLLSPCKQLPKRLTTLTSLSLLVSFLWSCGTLQVYKEPDRPVYASQERALTATSLSDSLRVVTFNIRKAEKIELAASELQQLQNETPVDIYLLQEMDEEGVAEIAKSLNLNYLYIPVVHHGKKDVGNAVLTKGAIVCAEKLLLPHAKPMSKSRRLVTVAEVTLNGEKILAYSVHTETSVMSRKNRMDQLDAIIENAEMQAPNYKYVLIGGDFNTLFPKSSKLAVEKFTKNGFDWSTASVGTTARAFFGLVKPRHDYIFTKGMKPLDAVKIETSKSSDHYPVLATFSYKP